MIQAFHIIQKCLQKTWFIKGKAEDLPMDILKKQISHRLVCHQMKIFRELAEWIFQKPVNAGFAIRNQFSQDLLSFRRSKRTIDLFRDFVYPARREKLSESWNCKVDKDLF